MHAVIGQHLPLDHDAKNRVRGDDLRAFGRNQVTAAFAGIQVDQRLLNLIAAERGRIAARQIFPCLLLGECGRLRVFDIRGWLFDGEVGRLVLFLGAHGGLGLHIRIGFAGFAVFLVGQPPQRACDRIGIILHWKVARRDAGAPVAAMRVIEIGLADPHAHVGHTLARAGGSQNASLRGHDHHRFPVSDVVAGEIGSGILFGKLDLAAMQLLFHRGEQQVVSRVRLLGVGGGGLLVTLRCGFVCGFVGGRFGV